MHPVDYACYKSEISTLRKHLRLALKLSDEFQVMDVLLRFGKQVPSEAFNWITYHPDPSLSVLEQLFNQKHRCDQFIKDCLKSITTPYMTTHDLKGLLTNTCATVTRNDVCFIQELLSNNAPLDPKPFPIENITANYITLPQCVDEIILETVYYAQPNILRKIIPLLQQYNITYTFEPLLPGRQKAAFQWLVDNLQNIRFGRPIGWQTGPDSGKWPSTSSNDYTEVYNLLKQLM